MPEFELYVDNPAVPHAAGLQCLARAQTMFDGASVSAEACARAYSLRDEIFQRYAARCPVDPKAGDPDDFDTFLREHHPGLNMAQQHRLAALWEEAMVAATNVAKEAMAGREPASWVLALRPIPGT